MSIEGKVAIVTGSGRGIGKAISILFAKKGVKTVVVARTRTEIEQTGKEIKNIGGDFLVLKGDVRKHSDVKNVVNKTLKTFGRIDFLINNAGVLAHKKLVETSENEYDEVMDTNVKGIFLFSKEAIPKMKEGVIINISSGAGHYAFANLSIYCASKFSVLAITESLAKEVKNLGIKVFAVCPGPVATRMQEKYMGGKYSLIKHLIVQPEKIAKKVIKLCEKPNSLSSGKCVNVYF